MWSSTQNVRIFDWKNILRQWNQGSSPHEVTTVLDNLARDQCPPLSHFLTYLNNEQEGLTWFIYECIASSWMWNSGPRLLFIRDTVDLLNNPDATFPEFPGSPLTMHTVRSFLTANLTEDQLIYIDMMPPLIPANRPVGTATTAPAPLRSPQYAPITFNVIRDRTESGKTDDLVVIRKTSDDHYSYTFTDRTSTFKKKCVHKDLTEVEVMAMLRTLFNFLVLDNEPFDCIQVTLPTTPSILLDTESLTSSTRDMLYDSVEMVFNSWPVYA
jgi:hypothetical protein